MVKNLKNENKKLIYYAHCLTIYNTKQEKRDIQLLRKMGFCVLNPNSKNNEKMYKKYGMKWFEDLVKKCDAVAFRAIFNGKIPSGIYKELNVAININIPIIELPSNIFGRQLSIDNTRQFLIESGVR